jgi:superfamily I DNA/RNA helicase
MAQAPQGLSAIDARCNAGERRVLHQLKRCLEDDYLVWHDIPIQSMGEEGFRRFNWRERGVKLLTMHSAKGLEFPWVAVAGLQALPLQREPLDEALRLVYVAMTRATQQLVLSAHGAGTPLVLRVEQALREVAARFAAG